MGEDATQYGEFISSYFAWIPLPEQKENAERMVRITKKNKTEPVLNAQRRATDDIQIHEQGKKSNRNSK